MSSLYTSLNSLLASSFTEYSRAPGANANTVNTAAKDLRVELGNLKPGTSVSARTDYTVNPQGQLVRNATSITVTTPDDAARNKRGGSAFTVADERPGSFSDLVKPRATLQPADEMELFASSANALVLPDAAQDENGDAVDVEILTPGEQPGASLSSQRQFTASSLYARNNDLIYTQDPVLAFAA